MANRRLFIKGIAAVSTVGIAGCAESEEDVSVELPPNSSLFFENGELSDQKVVDGVRQERTFPAGSFTQDQVGTDVSEFDLENADTSNVENMAGMFNEAESFDQDIGGWDTSNVENMRRVFDGTESFNQGIGGWDTSNVESMHGMFAGAESFNQDISGWDTSNVENMDFMFVFAESFNQDISGWCVEQISDKHHRFDDDAGFEGEEAKQPNWGEPC